jgi:Vitamin K-dependent gamma-carboxylase
MPGPVTLAHLRESFAAIGRAWSQFWFQERPTAPLELARIGIGAALLLHYGMATPYLLDFWGDAGWMPRDLAFENINDSWTQSVFFYFTAPSQWIAFHIFFLLCCTAFMLGWRTSWVKWIVLIGQISYDHRNPMLIYGVDKILAALLFILCLAPIGRALSLDRLRAIRAAKRLGLEVMPPPYASPWAGACTRLMQIQMAVLFLASGLEKVRGDDWWNGDAIWMVFTTNEFYDRVVLDLLASHYWLANVATYSTVLIELAYPFLIWQRRTRPYLLAAAIFLHLQFAALMGMPYFSFVMIMGHMSFVRPEWLTRHKHERFNFPASIHPR